MDFPEIPGYRIVKQLGKGGMAVVYLAVQANFERNVALKIMAKHLVADPSFGERFLREARIVAQLSHQHIVPVYDVGHLGDYHYMAMEYLPGGDLKARLKKGLPLSEGIKIIKAIASGLDYAHRKNFIHRDIKPENILFREDGSPVISDFGIARNTESETKMTMTGTVIGSPHYMSPEQAEAGQLDGRSDLYSLGIILYEMLTGSVPFSGESAISIGIKHITAQVPPLPEEMADFQEFVDIALSKDRDERFQTGEEFRAALEEIEATLTDTGASTVLITQEELRSGSSAAASRASAARASRVSRASGRSSGVQRRSGVRVTEPQKPALPRAAIALAIAGVASLGGAAAWYFSQSQGAVPATPGAASVQPSVLDRKNQELLSQAERALREQRYFAPPGDNAQYYLTTLLALNPNAPEAQAAIAHLFGTYLTRAESAVQAQNLEDANTYLNQSSQITFYIQDQALLDRQRQLRTSVIAAQQQQIIAGERGKEIEHRLSLAETALAEGKLTSPAGDNAYELYQSIFELDANNAKAQAGIRAVANAFLAKSRESIGKKDYQHARAMVGAATQVLPTHPELASAQAAIASAEEADLATLKAAEQAAYEAELAKQEQARKERQARIATLEREIGDDLAANRLTLPEGASALDKIRELQNLDPSNASARDGLDRLVDKLVGFARTALGKGDLDTAERHLKTAAQLSPTNGGVTLAQQELRAEKDRRAELAAVEKARLDSINRFLADAEKQIGANQPIAALGSIGKVLEIDASHQRAKALRGSVLGSVYSTVESQIQRGDLEPAETLLADLARINADSADVNRLRTLLANKRDAAAFAASEEGQLLAKATELEQKTRTADNNRTLSALYLKLVKLNPGEAAYKNALDKTSDFELKLGTAALQQRQFDAVRRHLAAAESATPRHAGIAKLKEDLAITERAQQQGSELLANARGYIQTPYQKPGLFGNNDAARQTYRNAFQAISSARQVDAGHPDLNVVFGELEERYRGIIALHMDGKDYKQAGEFVDDYRGFQWGRVSADMQAMLNDYDTKTAPVAQDSSDSGKEKKRTFVGGGF